MGSCFILEAISTRVLVKNTVLCMLYTDKKLSCRRETARQLRMAHDYLGWLTDRAIHYADVVGYN